MANPVVHGQRRWAVSPSLRVRIGFGFGLLAMVVFMAVVAVSGEQARQKLQAEAEGRLAQLASHVVSDLDVGMFERWREIQNLAAAHEDETAPSNQARWRARLDRMQATFPHYTWIGLMDASGQVLAASGGVLEGRDVSARPWFREALKAPFVGDVHDAVLLAKLLPVPADGEPLRLVDIVVPLREDGRVVAVLGAHLNWRWADQRRRQALSSAAQAAGIEILVLDHEGRVLLGPTAPAPPWAALAAVARNGPEALVWGGDADHAGNRFITAAVPSRGHGGYQGLGWTVVARQPETQALSGAAELQRHILALGAGGVMLFGLAGWWLAGWLTWRLRHAAKQARRLMPDAAVGHDEVGLLAGSVERLQDRATQLADANAELRSFNRSVSHDLKGPIGSIGVVMQQMLDDTREPLGEHARRSLATVATECERLVQLVDNLLALAMVEQREMAFEPLDMGELVLQVVQQLQPTVGAAEFALAPLPAARGDRVLLRQVWTNLLSNAIKFSSRAARPQIQIDAVCQGGETVFRVRDNGAGFEMAHASRLFQVFQRLHRPSDYAGTGVGLSIVQRAVLRHGGRVWAESAGPGTGALMCFALPGVGAAPPSEQRRR